MANRNCRIGKKAKAARRMAAVLMAATLTGTIAASTPGLVQVSAATWSENADYIFEVLTTKLGYSEAAACGIMANIRCESTFNPHAWNAGGGSYGLCQWTGGRYGRLQSWCSSNGYDYTTIDGQLAYLDYELKTHYSSVESYLRSVDNTADGAYDAGQYYCYHFEAPASRGSVSVYRGGLASGTFWEAYRPAEWYFEDGVWRYIKRDGTYHTSWLTIDNKTYYLDNNGNRISGWRTIDGNRYYFDKDGVMVTGWIKVDGRDYYFEEDGQLITGLVMNGKDWYMLDETGNIQASEEMEQFASGWVDITENEELASADKDAGSESTASAEEETTAAVSDVEGEASLAGEESSSDAEELASADTNSGKETVLPGIISLADAAEENSSSMPSLPLIGDTSVEAGSEENEESAAVSDNTASEAAASDNTAAEETVSANTADTLDAAGAAEKTEETVEETRDAATGATEAADSTQKASVEEAGEAVDQSEDSSKGADEFAAADALRAAAQAQDDSTDEADALDGLFMIFNPRTAEESSSASSTDAAAAVIPQIVEKEDTKESKEVSSNVEITLSDPIPFISLDEMDDLVKLLDEEDILRAITKDGKDITDQVKAEYEPVSPGSNTYKVTFSVELDGKTTELEATAFVKD